MRVEDGELVALVLEEPDLGVDLELEPVRGLRSIAAPHVLVRDSVAHQQDSTRLVGGLRLGVLRQCPPNFGGHYHQTVRSIDRSTSSASQKSAERYFQPASASTQTTTPSSRSAASLRATCATAPDETPAKIPSSSSSARTPATDSSFETSIFRSSFATSRIGGT